VAPEAARRFSELPKSEARQIFEWFVSGREARTDAFVDEVKRLGGPAERLDRSIDSLEPLWKWYVARVRGPWWRRAMGGEARNAMNDEQMRAQDPPWWYDFHPKWGQQMGTRTARLASGLIDYYFAVAERASAGPGWVMGSRRSQPSYQEPAFDIEGRGARNYSLPLIMSLRALEATHGGDRPEALRKLMEQWLGLDPAWEAEMRRLAEPLPAWHVLAVDHPAFTHQVSVRSDLAWHMTRRVDRLVGALAAEPGVEAAVREDREVILVRAPSLDEPRLLGVVERLWTEGKPYR
jgi:hypothetical protein